MENTLLSGDKVLVSKINYGARMPRSPIEIPWVNLAFYLSRIACTPVDSVWWKYYRVKGFSKIKRGDVMVFNHPCNRNKFLIKRCIGLPGETMEIKNAIIFCNNKKLNCPATAKLRYNIYINDLQNYIALSDNLGLPIFRNYYNRRIQYRQVLLTSEQYKLVINSVCVDSASTSIDDSESWLLTYPHNKRFLWTFENFGSIWIPKKGVQIELTQNSFILYKTILNSFEGQMFSSENGKIYNYGNLVKQYTFCQNYYFMLGDNRHNSNDSRVWGFVPEAEVVGKAILVLFSKDYNEFLWDRFLKKIE